jgi:hypothetical protein
MRVQVLACRRDAPVAEALLDDLQIGAAAVGAASRTRQPAWWRGSSRTRRSGSPRRCTRTRVRTGCGALVTLFHRRADLHETMSEYLIRDLEWGASYTILRASCVRDFTPSLRNALCR